MPKVKIKPQHVYFDKRSVEKGVGMKAKYKLAGYTTPLEGVSHPRLFWILTSQPGRSSNDITVTIDQSHWHKFDSASLMEPISYLSHSNSEELSNRQILAKKLDVRNGFLLKAKLSDTKFEEFRDKLSKLKLSPTRTVEDIKRLAASTVSQETDATDILKNLHLI